MMLKITTVPDKVKPVFDEFRDEFTEPSFESLTQLTSAVINENWKERNLAYKNTAGELVRELYPAIASLARVCCPKGGEGLEPSF